MGLAFLLGHFFGSLALAGMWVATFVAERMAALARANHILAALTLYYLPGPADVKALGHALPELEA